MIQHEGCNCKYIVDFTELYEMLFAILSGNNETKLLFVISFIKLW